MTKQTTLKKSMYTEIKQVLEKARNTAYTAVNFSMVVAYWNIGRIIVCDEQKGKNRAEYGEAVLDELSKRITKDFGKGFETRNLRNMRQFYLYFKNWHSVSAKLTWTHYRCLLRVVDKDAREWYMKEAISEHWSVRQLDRQISTLYYERILGSKNKKPVKTSINDKLLKFEPEEYIKDPCVLEFLNLKNYPELHEGKLEEALINNLQDFLLELGKGFCFVARQKRMEYENENFYIDLVFYNKIARCYVLIDLKIGKLTHQDIGQMDSYIRMFDDLEKSNDDNPTIGIIMCSEKNEAVVKYSILNDKKQVYATKYELAMPKVSVLKKELEKSRKQYEKVNSIANYK